jgi:predicted acylesterase/phospholipase RssA
MKTALVLGGGGALGDFELGVLQYLYQYNIRPQIICGTSVGAINAAKLAEGEGTPQETDRGFKGLQNIWLQNMNSPADMYVKEPAFAALPDDIQNTILSQLAQSAAAGVIFGGLFTSILALFGFGSSDSDKVQAFLNSSALYNLSPIESLARQRLNPALIGGSGIKLRMATVSLESGTLKYATESGAIVLDGEMPDPSVQPQPGLIFDGMLGSAAIPGFFKMRKIGNENFVDGGIRVNVPIKAALDLGATEIFAILPDPPLSLDPSYDTKTFVDIWERAPDIMLDQQRRDQLFPRNGLGARLVKIIAPGVQVHGSRDIDPGLIRINSSYGYMKAYDNLSQQLEPNARPVLMALSDLIAGKRRDIWNLEVKLGYEFFNRQSFISQNNSGGVQSEESTIKIDLPALRSLKNQLEGYVQCRRSIAAQSLPSDADSWWLSWEQHSDGIVNGSLPKNLWDQVVFNPGFPALGIPPDVIPAATPTAIPYPGCPSFISGSTPNGNYIQSDFGNYEMVIQQGAKISHYWRDNGDPNHPWHYGSDVPTGTNFGGSFRSIPDSVSLFQDDFPSRLYPMGNFEVLVHFTETINTLPPSTTDHLATFYFDFKENQWFGPFEIIADGNIVSGVTGKPVIIQSDFGNFEMVVPQGETLMHYWRDNSDGGQPWQYLNHPWHKGFQIVSPEFGRTQRLGGVAFFQSKRFTSGPGNNGNFEVIAHLTEQSPVLGGGTIDGLYTYTLDWGTMKWTIEAVIADGNGISGVTGRPAYIQSDFGNYELIVPQGNRLAHYWRDNNAPNRPWHKGLPDIPLPVSLTFQWVPDSISLFQSKVFRSGSGGNGSFEVLVHLTPSGIVGKGGAGTPTDMLVTYYSDWGTGKWVGPTVVNPNGNQLSGVSPF